MTHTFSDHLLICGAGLIGGSLALALARAQARPARIEVLERDAARAAEVLRLGIADAACAAHDEAALRAAVQRADLIVVAAPVLSTAPLIARLAPWLRPGTAVTDVGSVKGDTVRAVAAIEALDPSCFVPGHPIAGSETSGPAAARADLFDGRRTVLCPGPDVAPQALARVEAMWRAAGARLVRLDAQRHDAVFAAISHLPHLLAFAYLEAVLDGPVSREALDLAGPGFGDFSRIAASNPDVWRDICLANRDALLADLDRLEGRLASLRGALEAGRGEELAEAFARAAQARRAWRPNARVQPDGSN